MISNVYNRAEKHERAVVIRAYMAAAGLTRAVCFSCGNAANSLRAVGIRDLVEVGPGPQANMCPTGWWTPAEIHNTWPDRFDATSGHLPAPLMTRIAHRMRQRFPDPTPRITIPAGSGETIVVWHIAHPTVTISAVYDDRDPSTTYNEEAPLNEWVAAIATTRLHITTDGKEHPIP